MEKLVVGQEISIINEMGEVEGGYKIADPAKVDRQGLIAVDKDGTILRIHPKRIVNGKMPEEPVTEQAPQKPTPKQPKPAPTKVDIGAIANSGELWVRAGIDFDGQTEVNTYCLLVPAKGRYLSFNTYNGTFGKKGNQPPIQDLMDGKDVGYPIKEIEKLRVKLTKHGYKPYGG